MLTNFLYFEKQIMPYVIGHKYLKNSNGKFLSSAQLQDIESFPLESTGPNFFNFSKLL